MQAALRLVGSVFIETSDGWQAGHRYFSLWSMRKLGDPVQELDALPRPPKNGVHSLIGAHVSNGTVAGQNARVAHTPLTQTTTTVVICVQQGAVDFHHLTRHKYLWEAAAAGHSANLWRENRGGLASYALQPKTDQEPPTGLADSVRQLCVSSSQWRMGISVETFASGTARQCPRARPDRQDAREGWQSWQGR